MNSDEDPAGSLESTVEQEQATASESTEPFERYIVVRNWERFQHYRGRTPPWIKNYTELLDDPAYLGLTWAQRGVLHALWLQYAKSRKVVPTLIQLRHGLGGKLITKSQLKALNHAGFIEFSASAPLAERYQDAMLERERETTPIPSRLSFSPNRTTPRAPAAAAHYAAHAAQLPNSRELEPPAEPSESTELEERAEAREPARMNQAVRVQLREIVTKQEQERASREPKRRPRYDEVWEEAMEVERRLYEESPDLTGAISQRAGETESTVSPERAESAERVIGVRAVAVGRAAVEAESITSPERAARRESTETSERDEPIKPPFGDYRGRRYNTFAGTLFARSVLRQFPAEHRRVELTERWPLIEEQELERLLALAVVSEDE